MKIMQKQGKYLVESSSTKDTYTINLEQPFCDCPDFIFRAVKENSICKHIKAVKEYLKK